MTYAVIPVILAVLGVALGRRLLTLLMILAYLAMEGFLKLLSNYNPVVHVGLDIIVLAVTLWLAAEAMVRRSALPALPWTRLLALYALWIVLQLLNPNSPGLVPSLASFKTHLTMVPLYFFAAHLFTGTGDIRRFLVGVVTIGLVPFTFALVQYALGPASVLDLSPRFWQNISYFHEWRPFGTSALPGGASVFAYLCAPAALVLLSAPSSRSVRVLALVSIMMAAGVFIVSGVRQTFLGCVLALATMAAVMLSRRRGAGAAALGASVVVGLAAWVAVQTWLRPMATENIAREARAPEIWRERDVTQRLLTLTERRTYLTARVGALTNIVRRAEHYPFGAGLGRTGSAAGTFAATYASDPRSAQIQSEVGWSDNFFADMIAETGLPGVVMLSTILLGMLVGAFRLARHADDTLIGATSAALTGFYVSVLAMSWGSQPLLANPITAYFWTFSGMLAAMRRMEQEGTAPEGDESEAWDPGAVPARASL